MSLILNIFRGLTAIIAPLTAVILTALTLIAVNKQEGDQPQEEQNCIRCGESRKGAKGTFQFTENNSSTRPRAASKQLTPSDNPILGSESHFVCDTCTRRNIRNEIIQHILMVIPYPIYLYVIIPLFLNNGNFASFLIETLLVVLSVAGVSAAFELYRSIQKGETPLAEARDRVVIRQRKNALGKKFTYYTRLDRAH